MKNFSSHLFDFIHHMGWLGWLIIISFLFLWVMVIICHFTIPFLYSYFIFWLVLLFPFGISIKGFYDSLKEVTGLRLYPSIVDDSSLKEVIISVERQGKYLLAMGAIFSLSLFLTAGLSSFFSTLHKGELSSKKDRIRG